MSQKQQSMLATYGGKFPKVRDKDREAKAMLLRAMRGEKC